MFSLFKPKPVDPAVHLVAKLVTIADKFDANQLTGIAQRVGCCGLNTLPPEHMVLVHDRTGRPLLTVADCLAARAAMRGEGVFKTEYVEPSQ